MGLPAPEAMRIRFPNSRLAHGWQEPRAADGRAVGASKPPGQGSPAEREADARSNVGGLLSSIGLRPIDAGQLANARYLEGLTFLNIKLQVQPGGNWDTAFAMVSPLEEAVQTPALAFRREVDADVTRLSPTAHLHLLHQTFVR